MVPRQGQLSWSPVRALPNPSWIVMGSQQQDGNLLLIQKQPVASLTGKILHNRIFFPSSAQCASYPKQIITDVLILLAVREYLQRF